jgi:hypothetical protein
MVSVRFIAGVILLLTNQVIGWAGMAVGIYLAKKFSRKIFYFLGVGIYGFSWAMLAFGAYLAGPQGIALVKHFFLRFRRETIILGIILVILTVGYFWRRYGTLLKSKTIR